MKVAINGLGRIGRLVLKSGLDEGINFVAVNDLILGKSKIMTVDGVSKLKSINIISETTQKKRI